MVGVATVNTTVRVKAVVLVTPPPVAVTVIRNAPPGVEAEVPIVNTEEQLGLQLPGENEALAPEGRPEADKETD